MSSVRVSKIQSVFGGEEFEIHYIAYDFNGDGVEFVAAFAANERGELIGNDGDTHSYDCAISFVDSLASYGDPITSWKEVFANSPYAYACIFQAQSAAKYYALSFDNDCRELKLTLRNMAKANLEKGGDK